MATSSVYRCTFLGPSIYTWVLSLRSNLTSYVRLAFLYLVFVNFNLDFEDWELPFSWIRLLSYLIRNYLEEECPWKGKRWFLTIFHWERFFRAVLIAELVFCSANISYPSKWHCQWVTSIGGFSAIVDLFLALTVDCANDLDPITKRLFPVLYSWWVGSRRLSTRGFRSQ